MCKNIILIITFFMIFCFNSNVFAAQKTVTADGVQYEYSKEAQQAWMNNCEKSAAASENNQAFCQCGFNQLKSKVPPAWFLTEDQKIIQQRQQALHAIFQFCAVMTAQTNTDNLPTKK